MNLETGNNTTVVVLGGMSAQQGRLVADNDVGLVSFLWPGEAAASVR